MRHPPIALIRSPRAGAVTAGLGALAGSDTMPLGMMSGRGGRPGGSDRSGSDLGAAGMTLKSADSAGSIERIGAGHEIGTHPHRGTTGSRIPAARATRQRVCRVPASRGGLKENQRARATSTSPQRIDQSASKTSRETT